jgi:hypothetical protein
MEPVTEMSGEKLSGASTSDFSAHSTTETISVQKLLVFAAIFVVSTVPLFSTPILPLIDFYNHLARFFVLSHIDSDTFLQLNYQKNWSILPNIGLDVIVVGLNKLLGTELQARSIIIMLFAVQFGGILYFNRAITGRYSIFVAIMAVPMLYSFILIWGFVNFLLGLGLVFWAAGWWLRQRQRLAVALPVACLLAAGIFFVHGVAFALYGILVGMLEIGLFLQRQERRLIDLVMAMLPLLAQAVVPVLLFLATKTSKNPYGITNADESVVKLSEAGLLADRMWALVQHRLTTILRVAEGPSLAFDAIVLAAGVGLLVALALRGRLAVARVAWPAIAVAVLLVVVTPPAMFGVGAIADRMPLFLALLVVGSVRPEPPFTRADTAIMAGFAALVALRLAATSLDWAGYARDNDDFTTVTAALPRHVLTESIIVTTARGDDSRRRCQMFAPGLISQHGAAGRLFANEDQQPLRIIGPLADAIRQAARPRHNGSYGERASEADLAAAVRGGFPWLLTCDANYLADRLPPGASVAASAGRFMLIRLPGAASTAG